jgi:hypothetical protein
MIGIVLLTAFLAEFRCGTEECSMSGRVYSASTGGPLKKVQVRVSSPGVNFKPVVQAISGIDEEVEPWEAR